MKVVHVFSGYGYYPQAGLGDYVKSFYGKNAGKKAIKHAKEYKKENGTDFYCVLYDDGDGLGVLEENWS